MKTNLFSYQLIFILLSLLFGPNGISSLSAHHEEFPRMPLYTDSITKDSLITDSAQQQAVKADSIESLNKKNMALLDATTDTAKLNQINDSLTHTVEKPRFIPNPTKALWLSLIIPGAGQVYNRKYWKIPIFYGGFLGCVYALSWNGQMYKDYSQAYLDIMDNDPKTDSYLDMLPINYDITGKEERFKEIFKNKKNFYRKYRDLSIFCMVGVYLLSVIDAYVDAELSSFDISKDLGLKIEPTIINNDTPINKRTGVGFQCRLNF